MVNIILDKVNRIKKRYSLGFEEFEEMYNKARWLTFKGKRVESEFPKAIFVGGQPGAGKSEIVFKEEKKFENLNKSLIKIDLDIYRNLFKNAKEISEKYPQNFSNITNKEAAKIMEKISEETINNGYDFIVEGTMAQKIYTLELIKKSNKKYNIIIKVMAVSKEESLLSIFERYIKMRKENKIARLTSIENHNIKYKNFLNVVKELENEGYRIDVYRRTNKKGNPQIINRNENRTALETIIEERKESRKECMINAKNRLNIINNEMSLLGDYKKLKKPLKNLNRIIDSKIKEETS
ncbi:MAG: zeta toxin family protein [Clostridia bacterium]|nr:zeta toxin family protein [Clostridia bacterium]